MGVRRPNANSRGLSSQQQPAIYVCASTSDRPTRGVSHCAARSRAEIVVMEKITFGDAAVPGYERGEKTAPAVIVLQEWWGVTKNITAQAERIASEGGYRVLIPDLYKGKLGVNVEEAHHLMSNLDWPPRKVRYATTPSRRVPFPVVVVTSSDAPVEKGPPWTPPPPRRDVRGGQVSQIHRLAQGCRHRILHGRCPRAHRRPTQRRRRLLPSLLRHAGSEHLPDGDHRETRAGALRRGGYPCGFSDPAAAARLTDNLKRAGGAAFEVFAYPGVGHAFMNDLPEPYPDFDARRRDAQGFPPRDEAQQKLAWRRAFAFLEKHLRG